MKPLLLEMQAFGPFVDKQTIDFEKLSGKGIFLIKGKTGSGKTTIFDAMTFALYGGSSGDGEKIKNGRNDIEEWRCRQAPSDKDTFVSFTFSSRGKKYKFTRSLVLKRKNFSAQYSACRINEDGTEVPLFENPKKEDLTKKAEEIIGLTKEQFRQVVLLPQGQFEKFLLASSAEKEIILQKIFSADRWSKYVDAFYRKANERKSALEEIKKEIQLSLNEDGLTDIEGLISKQKNLRNDKDQCEEAHKKFDSDAKQQALDEDIRLNKQFDPLHKLETEKSILSEKKTEIDKKKDDYRNSEKAETVRTPLSEYESAKKEVSSRSKVLEKLLADKPCTEEAKAKAEKAKTDHEINSPLESLNKEIGKLEDKRAIYESIGELEKIFKTADSQLTRAISECDKADKRLMDATEAAKSAKEKYDKADSIAKDYRNKYYAGVYGEIASELKENESCPVCGSTNHPFPAKRLPDSVSKDDMKKKESEAEEAKKTWAAAEEERSKKEADRNSKQSELAVKKTDHAKAKTEYDTAKSGLLPDIRNISELESRIKEAKGKIADYNKKTAELQRAFADASDRLTSLLEKTNSAQAEMKAASEKHEIAKEKLEKALAESGFATYEEAKSQLRTDAERKQLHADIVEYDTSLLNNERTLKEKQEELSGKIEPDETKFRDRQREIKEELAEYNRSKSRLETEEKRLSKKLSELTKKQTEFDSNIALAESDLAFARKLRGDSGIGLQRYVLAIMFNQIIGEANRMLTKIHGGRYHLFRTDEKGAGNQRGLELRVFDNRVPEDENGRSVSMLSGGEKFLVSLALSIGMSTIAQKTGVQIEALFIDEGFGTLDDGSISDAMDVLESVRKGAGTIGIISHVPLLEDNIMTHLEVLKSDEGSKVKID